MEVVPLLKSLEVDANAPFTLLQRWRSGIESGLDAHSLLVHHLKCIGLITTSYRYIVTYKKLNLCLLNHVNFVFFIDSIIGNLLYALTPQPERMKQTLVQ